jgi:hypothetical protein
MDRELVGVQLSRRARSRRPGIAEKSRALSAHKAAPLKIAHDAIARSSSLPRALEGPIEPRAQFGFRRAEYKGAPGWKQRILECDLFGAPWSPEEFVEDKRRYGKPFAAFYKLSHSGRDGPVVFGPKPIRSERKYRGRS